MRLKSVFHYGVALLASLLVVLALLVTALRLGIPDLNAWRPQIFRALFPDTTEIDASSLSLSWQDFGLQLDVRDAHLSQPLAKDSRLTFTAKSISLHCNPFITFWKTQGCLADARIEDADVTYVLPAKLPVSNQAPDPDLILTPLLERIRSLSIQNSALTLLRGNATLAVWKINRLVLDNRDDLHRLSAQSLLAQQALVVPLTFQAEFLGPARWNALQGHIYLATNPNDETHFDGLFPTPLAENVRSVHGKLDFQFWLERKPGAWQDGLLTLGQNQLNWQQQETEHSLAMQGGDIRWQKTATGWTMQSHDLQVRSSADAWRPWHLNVVHEGSLFEGQVDPILLNDLVPIASLFLPVGSPGEEALRTLAPEGRIEGISFSHDERSDEWKVSGLLSDLTWQKWRMIPGLSGIQGQFEVTKDGVTLSVHQAAPQEWDIQPYFEKAWPVSAFSADLKWQLQPQGWTLEGKHVHLQTDNVTTETDFSLSQDNALPLFLALDSRVDLADARAAHFYFPHGAMGEPIIQYLTEALQGGTAENARILWHGALSDFPYHQHAGVFQAWVPLRNATFAFGKGWQPLTDLSLNLLFENDQLDMQGDFAHLSKATASRLHAWIPNLAPGAHLYIDADVAGEGEEVSQYLYDSPLQKSVGSALQSVQISKPITGTLQLDIPLDGAQVNAKGEVTLKQNNLFIPSMDLPLTNLDGVLKFDNDQTAISDLKASLWGQPVQVDYQGKQTEKAYQMKLGIQSEWSKKRDTLFDAAIKNNLSGDMNWKGDLDLQLYPGGHYYYQASVNSNLNGLGLDFPLPFRKSANRSWPLQLSLSGNQDSSVIKGSLNHEWRLDADWSPQSARFNRFWLDNLIVDRQAGPSLPFSVNALLSEADVSAWLDWWKQWSDAGGQASSQRFPAQGAADVRVDKLHIGEQIWRNVRFNLTPDRNGNRIWLESNNVQGNIRLPKTDSEPVKVDLARLYWSETTNKDQTPLSLSEQQNLLSRWPRLNFTCQDCRYGGNVLGQINAELVPVKDGGEIRHLHWQVANTVFDGDASWLIQKNQPVSRIKGKLDSSNTELFLGHFGFDPGLTGTKSHASFDVSWPGALIQPKMASLNGDIKVVTEEGILREIKNTGGNRLLSLFSLNAIVQRISLDFRDIFSDGLYFKRISFSGKLNQGVLRNNDLILESHSGELNGHGTVDLGKQLIDYEVTFSPQLTGGFGVATAFAITPITGVVVLAATTLLQPFFDAITEVSYGIHGPLMSPAITELGRKKEKVKLETKDTTEKK